MPKKSEGEFPIRAVLRCRPRNKAELEAKSGTCVVTRPGEGKADLQVKQAGKVDTRTYTYDSVFGQDSTQVSPCACASCLHSRKAWAAELGGFPS